MTQYSDSHNGAVQNLQKYESGGKADTANGNDTRGKNPSPPKHLNSPQAVKFMSLIMKVVKVFLNQCSSFLVSSSTTQTKIYNIAPVDAEFGMHLLLESSSCKPMESGIR